MLYLLLTILLNTFIFTIFKLFPKYGIDNLQAIVVNYFTCVVTGCLFIGQIPFQQQNIQAQWFPWALLMGLMFVSIFNFIAWRTREDGMTTTTIANKLSLVIPVLFSVFLYNDHLSAINIIGIVAAIPAVYLTAQAGNNNVHAKSLLFPALLFILSGLLDTLVKFVEHFYLPTPQLQAVYTIHVFLIAGILGLCLIIYLKLKGRIVLTGKNLVAGIILGVPNYFSIYFLIRLLNANTMQSAVAIPVNNIGIVVTSALTAIILFREHVTRQRIAGLSLAIIAILLIAYTR